MHQIFISHSGSNSAEALALKSWLDQEGWGNYFLDLSGIVPGENFREAFLREADDCKVLICVVSQRWIDSDDCRLEFLSADGRGKCIISVLVEEIALPKLPTFLTNKRQVCSLVPAEDPVAFTVGMPPRVPMSEVRFSRSALADLARGLRHAGVDPHTFQWPPQDEPDRSPYRGLQPLDEVDAAVFFGRDAEIVYAMEQVRRVPASDNCRLLAITGPSGAGKSSFLRAGLLPRLRRDVDNFVVLKTIRCGNAAMSGTDGLVASLAAALHSETSVAEIRKDLTSKGIVDVLRRVASGRPLPRDEKRAGERTVIVPIDQAEELFAADGIDEARALLAHVDAVGRQPRWGTQSSTESSARVLFLMTLREDAWTSVQKNETIRRLAPEVFELQSMPNTELKSVIEGPARIQSEKVKRVTIDPRLKSAIMNDAKGADALPLLAATLGSIYHDQNKKEGLELTLDDCKDFGANVISAAVERAVRSTAVDSRSVETLFFQIATVDADASTPLATRRIASRATLRKAAPEADALVSRLIEERLLVSRVENSNEVIEVAHEALLRQWGTLKAWFERSAKALEAIERVHRFASEWEYSGHDESLLVHTRQRLREAEMLRKDVRIADRFDSRDISYLTDCRKRDNRRCRWKLALLGAGVGGVSLAVAAIPVVRSAMWARANDLPLAYTVHHLQWQTGLWWVHPEPIPRTVDIKPGNFVMGCLAGRVDVAGATCEPDEAVTVTLDRPCAMGAYEVSFLEYDYYAWAMSPASPPAVPFPKDWGYGRLSWPVINVNWNDAQGYVKWLSQKTGQSWRLPTEIEWEYAARAGTQSAYHWGSSIGKGHARCAECGQRAGDPPVEMGTVPVGSYAANRWGVHDTAGNVAEWVADLAEPSKSNRVLRGGSWNDDAAFVRSAHRSDNLPSLRSNVVGFRVCRDLPAQAPAQSLAPDAKQAKRL